MRGPKGGHGGTRKEEVETERTIMNYHATLYRLGRQDSRVLDTGWVKQKVDWRRTVFTKNGNFFSCSVCH